jgi:hypothetical protein
LAELKKMAFDPDPKRENCYYEPSLDVRNLALEALNICPPVTPKEDDEPVEAIKETGIGETGGDGEEEEGISESAEVEGEVMDLNPPKDGDGEESGKEKESEDTPPSPDDEDTIPLKKDTDNESTIRSFNRGNFQQVGYGKPNLQLLDAKIVEFVRDGYVIELSNDYLIPQGYQLYILGQNGQSNTVEIVESNQGIARVKIVDGLNQIRTPYIQFGIIQ